MTVADKKDKTILLTREPHVMPYLKPEVTESVLQAAEFLAANLGLTRRAELPSSFKDGEMVLVASGYGIEVGEVRVNYEEKRIHNFTEFILHGEVLVKQTERYNQFDGENVVSTSFRYPEGAVIYTAE